MNAKTILEKGLEFFDSKKLKQEKKKIKLKKLREYIAKELVDREKGLKNEKLSLKIRTKMRKEYNALIKLDKKSKKLLKELD